MEEQSKKLDAFTKGLIDDAGTYKPSKDFINKVLANIEPAPASVTYKPLIPVRSWVLIGMVLIGWSVVTYFIPDAQFSLLTNYDFGTKLDFENPFSGITFSKTMVYAVGCTALFLVQIPFLKRYFSKA